MNIQENISLKYFTTFQIGGRARYFLIAKNEDDLREAFSFVKSRKLPLFVLGGGSNVLFSDQDFSGLIIKNEIKGIKFIDLPVQAGQGMDKVILEIGAGEIWDDIVALSVIRNLFGLENLSGIPGTVGGAVVQNAGAYGGELKDCLVSVAGFNSVNGKKFNFEKADCDYGYRSSFFKKNKKFIITSVTLILSKKLGANFDYASLKEQLTEEEKITPQKIREIVLKVRGEKLPDWHKIGTAGSFFKNPVISKYDYSKLVEKFPDLPGFSEPKDKIKIPLAWILDKICQLKGFKEGRVGLYEKQPLVVVNLGGATEKEISDFTEKIKNIVVKKTSIKIECEVEKI
ncbi:MAG: UDP-N-acetylenolpyruvoylglucosamine reductase [Candidatus Taylorbacteria bacterium RIFOXYD2_FULL_36_9]|uniref:UDP-N-acetylenolpyruvoylglucosamine reductase n=1 Tax=Candidatus Taylorbacteria bacterium RIFOXYD2_FULL_36_9 TaxID=1802338 RepID=A0A1G2PCE6_9BACT|nr:MAG: UDP-N-acetylenolpyruvoylglucosamine reductase [Candidatus Taylorbacteria bacterium RIFOXYD2_FULL_36_9]